ncbi:sugar transport STP1 [Fusarium pseudocircinatum]|uniref:Sugar transport STP1 n=1 Tax=Fusarium pseudocircinatum TaxID=56676 RepID=A0A8H5LDQ3_9HYPO|nr:sugar transport STP1 [Fusarium pseudocircinatum]
MPPPSPPEEVVAPIEHDPCANFSYWSLDDELVCRVAGMECYGESFEGTTDLWYHLQTAAHVKHDALLAWEWVESPSSSSTQPSHSLHQPPTSISPAPETDFVVVEVDEELEAEKAIDASQSAVAAEPGNPLLNAPSKTTSMDRQVPLSS